MTGFFLPFFPAWSSQFSKVHGPQAPQGDTSQAMGQGIWHSWDRLGIEPSHRWFSTGREAARVRSKRETGISRRNNKQNENCFTLITFPIFTNIVIQRDINTLLYVYSQHESPCGSPSPPVREENSLML